MEFSAVASPERARAALDEVLGSETFARSEQLRNFLRYVCDRALAGQGKEINEYSVAVEALGKDAGFSPGEDSSVRTDQVYRTSLLPAAARLRVLSVLRAHSAIEGESQAHAAPLPDPKFRSRTAIMTCTSARAASRGSRWSYGMSISTPPSDMVGASDRAPLPERVFAVRDLSVISSPRWIP